MKRVVVIGAGVAGTAAALGARDAGADVTILDGGTGASTLCTGALDFVAWDTEKDARPAPLDERAMRLFDALDVFAPIERYALIATTAGIVRTARAIDRALLDLGALGAGTVLVPRVDHAGWPADSLARAWTSEPRATARGVTFRAVDAHLLRFAGEGALPDADLAARHDDPERLAWLAARLADARRESHAADDIAMILPPWLGVERPRARELSDRVGLPIGEALGMPGGPSGLRFERARTRVFAKSGVECVAGWVPRFMEHGAQYRIDGLSFAADAVVVATGGFVGGGIAYRPSDALVAGELPPRAARPFVASLEGPLVVGVKGEPLALPGSLFGVAPETFAWPCARDAAFTRVGLLACNGRIGEGAYAAGDVVADGPRTWLAALLEGYRAGRAAGGA